MSIRCSKKSLVLSLIWMLALIFVSMESRMFATGMMPVVIAWFIFNVLCSLFPLTIQMSLPLIVIRVTGFARYVLLPIAMKNECISLSSYYGNSIVIIMIVELIATYLGVLLFVYKKPLDWKYKKYIKMNSIVNQKIGLSAMIILILGSIFIMINRGYIERYFSISASKTILSDVSGIVELVVSCFFLLIFIIALNFVKNIPIKNNLIKVMLSVIASVFYINGSSVTGANVSRWSMLIAAIVAFVYILKFYPSYKKQLVVLLIAVVVFSVTIGTVIKFGENGNSNYTTVNRAIEEQFSYDSINAYFSGTKNMEVAFMLKGDINNKYISKIKVIWSDIFANFPFLNKYLSNPSNQLTLLFNYKYYNSLIATDQIIPFSGQLYIYFGGLFMFVELIFVYYAMKLYFKIGESNDFLKIYCLIYLTFSLALMNCISFSVMLQNTWIHVLPVFLIYLFNINIRKKNIK